MKRTREEYEAAAMLLDLMYDDVYSIFFTPTVDKCIDADTLEIVYEDLPELTGLENSLRFRKYIESRKKDAHS